MSKNCDDVISLAHHNELSLLLGYEEMKRITKDMPEFVLDKVLDFDLEEIYMYCAVNCIENTYIANYIKTRKQIEESGNKEEPSIQPISLIRSSKRRIEPHMM